MPAHATTIFTLRNSANQAINSFSTDTYRTAECAYQFAKSAKKRYNASELGQTNPVRITRRVSTRIVHDL